MKKIKYLILSIFSIATLYSCSDMEDIRNDIDDLNARLDKLEAQLPQINQDIENFQGILNGQILVLGYNLDEETGDYTIDLSNGTTITVYSNNVRNEDIPLMSIGTDGNWYYTLNGETKPLLDGQGNPVSANPTDGKTPEFSVDENGLWIYRYDDGEWLGGLGVANPVQGSGENSIFDSVTVSEDGNSMTFTWTTDAGQLSKTVALFGGLSLTVEYGDVTPVVFGLGQVQKFNVVQEGVENIVIETTNWGIELGETEMTVTAPKVNVFGKDYEDKLVIKIFSKEGYCRLVTIPVKLLNSTIDENSAIAWQNFLSGMDNVLLDYSYAGYMHGEVAPPDINIDFSNKKTDTKGNVYYEASLIGGAQNSVTYKVYNINDYGANGNDNLSDRHALIKIFKDVMGCTQQSADNNKTLRYYIGSNVANAIIYFPEGKYILRGGDETETVETLRFTMGNLIFKGAGKDKTVIEMAVKNNATDPTEMWSTPNLLEFKHNSGLSDLTTVTGDAEKGTFSIEVASVADIKVGDWICLYLKNNNPELISEELFPYSVDNRWTELNNNGVQVYDYHQVKSISGNTLTFHEPIMRKVESKWEWKIQKYPHYENVGVEDLKFLGHAKEDFKHHGSADDDGGFKPVQMIRLTNSWMRRVDFESVSEAHSFVSCSNTSAYDIEITGNRGHSAIRSQASSRVFIGKVYDHSNGKIALDTGGTSLGEYMEGAGQYHACGVSKQSMGAVIWNVTWGKDACFESHATQPRATLIDMCTGGFMPWREGGDMNQLPNHLNDLTIWNMKATRVNYHTTWGNKFIWWDANNDWWRNLPPVIVGWSGEAINFDTSENQLKYYESLNAPVYPNSLYEAQLQKRLGYVPAWLNSLK